MALAGFEFSLASFQIALLALRPIKAVNIIPRIPCLLLIDFVVLSGSSDGGSSFRSTVHFLHSGALTSTEHLDPSGTGSTEHSV